MKRNLAFLLLPYLFVLPFTNGFSQENYVEKVDALFADKKDANVPGGAVIVVKEGEVVLNRAYGMANLEHQIPNTSTTVFDIASVSKQFCGFAIASLIVDGKIAYEDDVRKYIPELPDFGKTITIRHLVHHISGVRDWTSSLSLAGWSFNDVISFDQILRMAYHQEGLNFKPGSEYTYSNTGYNLLARVVEKVSGKSFREWTEEFIFQPLAMNNSHFQDDHTEVVPNRAYGYSKRSNGEYHLSKNSLTALGSSSLFTTTEDLAKWVKNFDQPRKGHQAILDQMMQKGVLNNGKEIDYAFGINVNEYKGLKRISHGGSWASFRTYLAHFPDQRLSVVVLMNSPDMNSYRTAHKIADVFLEEYFEEEEQEETEKVAKRAVKVSKKVLSEYLGTYKLGPAWYVTITQKGNQLYTRATQEDAFPMSPSSDSVFVVEAYGGSTISFKRNEQGEVSHFVYRGLHCPKLGEKSIPALDDFIGVYKSEELNTIYEISLENGQLVAHHRENGAISLSHAWGDDFMGERWFMRGVEFQRDKDGLVNGFLVTQQRSRNQPFIKIEK